MRVWLYGKDLDAARALLPAVSPLDTVAGISAAEPGTAFPLGGLVRAMCAAVRGEVELLLVPDLRALGNTPAQAAEITEQFQACGVSVRSASSRGSRSS